MATLTASTIAFVNGASTITDSGSGLGVFPAKYMVKVTGGLNDGKAFYITASAAGTLNVTPAPTTEAAGSSRTLTTVANTEPGDVWYPARSGELFVPTAKYATVNAALTLGQTSRQTEGGYVYTELTAAQEAEIRAAW